MTNNSLSKKNIDEIKLQARKKLSEYCKLNDVLGSQVFNVLEKENKVLYYPLEDQQVWGFSEKYRGRSFVCINTSLPYDKQVFAAGHELYHLWYNNKNDVILSDEVEETAPNPDMIELMANRFAAEFLVDEGLLRQEIKTYGIDSENIDIKDIISLSHLFVVPYRMMVKRLKEVKLLNSKAFNKFISFTDDQIEIWKTRLGYCIPTRENKISLSNLVDKAMELYDSKLITYDKLESVLEMSELTPAQLGVWITEYKAPTDDELDMIMEELM